MATFLLLLAVLAGRVVRQRRNLPAV